MHLSVCTECAAFAKSLQQTVTLLKATTTPSLSPDFDQVLAAKLAAVAAEREAALKAPRFVKWLNRMRTAVTFPAMTTGERLRLAAPVAVASVMLGFLAFSNPTGIVSTSTGAPLPATDAGFAIACVHQSHTYLSGQPFADPSAQALMQRQTDDSLAQSGANLLGDGKI
jgi:hypothetical protein